MSSTPAPSYSLADTPPTLSFTPFARIPFRAGGPSDPSPLRRLATSVRVRALGIDPSQPARSSCPPPSEHPPPPGRNELQGFHGRGGGGRALRQPGPARDISWGTKGLESSSVDSRKVSGILSPPLFIGRPMSAPTKKREGYSSKGTWPLFRIGCVVIRIELRAVQTEGMPVNPPPRATPLCSRNLRSGMSDAIPPLRQPTVDPGTPKKTFLWVKKLTSIFGGPLRPPPPALGGGGVPRDIPPPPRGDPRPPLSGSWPDLPPPLVLKEA